MEIGQRRWEPGHDHRRHCVLRLRGLVFRRQHVQSHIGVYWWGARSHLPWIERPSTQDSVFSFHYQELELARCEMHISKWIWLPRVTYLVWTCNDLGELALFLILSLHYGFNDTWMIRTQVYEAVCDSGFPYGFEEGEGSGVNPMLALSLGTQVVQREGCKANVHPGAFRDC